MILLKTFKLGAYLNLLHISLVIQYLDDTLNAFLNVKNRYIFCKVLLFSFEHRIIQNIVNKKVNHLGRVRNAFARVLETIVGRLKHLF